MENVARGIFLKVLSVVFPCSKTEVSTALSRAIVHMDSLSDVETIFVGRPEAKSRAQRLNIGFHQSQGKLVLFHHPRSIIEPEGIKYLADLSKGSLKNGFWGGFQHQFDLDHPILKLTSWYSNNVRPRYSGILYLDHCIFFERGSWLKDIEPVEIFEDTLLSYSLRKNGSPIILPFKSTTSSVRFKENGLVKQCLLNQFLKIGFHLKISHRYMNKLYDGKLKLN